MASRIVSHEAGMGSSTTAGLAFSTKRLVREYGSAPDLAFGKLSISADVYGAFTRPSCYKLAILKTIFQKRRDFDHVLSQVHYRP